MSELQQKVSLMEGQMDAMKAEHIAEVMKLKSTLISGPTATEEKPVYVTAPKKPTPEQT